MAKVDDIRDDGVRGLVAAARTAYREGNSTTSVHKSVEALLMLMQKQPDLIQLERAPGTPVRKGYVWPTLGVKVETGENQQPRAVEALLMLMQKQPDLIQLERAPGTPVRKGYVWPTLGVKVETGENQQPRAVYARDQFSTAEAITFYEFAVDSAVAAESEA